MLMLENQNMKVHNQSCLCHEMKHNLSRILGTLVMATAWRERNPAARITAAKEALVINPDCAPALLLLAEEEAATVLEAEQLLKQALKAAEASYRKSQQNQHQGPLAEGLHSITVLVTQNCMSCLLSRCIVGRDTNVLICVKRRLAMCARKLGKLKEAVKMFRDVRTSPVRAFW